MIADYGSLKAAVIAWNPTIAGLVDEIVQVAQANVRRDVRTRHQEAEVAGSTVLGAIACPPDMVDARYLTVDGRVFYYVTPQQRLSAMRAGAGRDEYTIVGNQLLLVGAGDGLAYVLGYWREFTPLMADADTNGLLTRSPDLYLWAGCAVGAEYMKDYEQAGRFKALYDQAVQSVNTTEAKMRSSGSRLSMWADNVI